MRPGPAAIAALMLVAALILPGCGNEKTSAAGATDAEKRVRTTQAPQCRRALGDFLDATESLNNTVAAGVSYGSYLRAVNHVRATYAPIQADHLPLLCLTQVAAPAEWALNAYIEAANTWGDCLAGASCETGSIEPRLQRAWGRASDLLGQAQRGLSQL